MTDNREHHRKYGITAPYFGTAPEALLQGFSHFPEIEIHVLSCTQQRMSSPEKLADNIWFHSLHVPKIGWLRTGYQGCIRAVRRKLKEINPDIVHGQGTERECAISAALSGYPNVVTIHGNMAELARMYHARPFSFGWMAARLEDITLPRAGGVFCNSTYTESLVARRTKKTWRVDNAIRSDFFRPLMGREREMGEVVRFINIGVISKRKRQLEILEVFQQLYLSGVPVHVDFIGEADEASPYARRFLSAISSANPFARFVGRLNLDEIISKMDDSDAMIHFPSEEAFGLVVAESLSRNMKFFGSRLGGILDICNEIEGAELFAANDWNGISEAIKQWIKAGAAPIHGAAAVVRKHYAPDVIAGKHLSIYHEISTSLKSVVD